MEKTDYAIKLAKLLNGNDTMRSVTNELAKSFTIISKETLKKITSIFTRKKNMTAILEETAIMYRKYYTSAELKALYNFYSSKVGKKHREITIRTLSETLAIGQRWGQKVITENMKEIESILTIADSKEMESRGIDLPLQNRLNYATNYARAKGWDVKNLTAEQVMEIRAQDGWKEAGEKS